MSALSAPPAAVKNFSPFRFQGRWLAVIITAASNSYPGVTVVMNMAGVVHRPMSVTFRPQTANSPHSHCAIVSPESRESRPTDTRSGPPPRRARSHAVKPRAMCRTASSVSVTSSPGIPGSATPRISLPF